MVLISDWVVIADKVNNILLRCYYREVSSSVVLHFWYLPCVKDGKKQRKCWSIVILCRWLLHYFRNSDAFFPSNPAPVAKDNCRALLRIILRPVISISLSSCVKVLHSFFSFFTVPGIEGCFQKLARGRYPVRFDNREVTVW